MMPSAKPRGAPTFPAKTTSRFLSLSSRIQSLRPQPLLPSCKPDQKLVLIVLTPRIVPRRKKEASGVNQKFRYSYLRGEVRQVIDIRCFRHLQAVPEPLTLT